MTIEELAKAFNLLCDCGFKEHNLKAVSRIVTEAGGGTMCEDVIHKVMAISGDGKEPYLRIVELGDLAEAKYNED